MRVQIYRLCSVGTDCLLTEKKSITFFCPVLIGRDWANDGIRGTKGEEKRERERERIKIYYLDTHKLDWNKKFIKYTNKTKMNIINTQMI